MTTIAESSRKSFKFGTKGETLEALAHDWYEFADFAFPDGCVEALCHRQAPILAVQWHPEREKPFADFDRWLLQNHLGRD